MYLLLLLWCGWTIHFGFWDSMCSQAGLQCPSLSLSASCIVVCNHALLYWACLLNFPNNIFLSRLNWLAAQQTQWISLTQFPQHRDYMQVLPHPVFYLFACLFKRGLWNTNSNSSTVSTEMSSQAPLVSFLMLSQTWNPEIYSVYLRVYYFLKWSWIVLACMLSRIPFCLISWLRQAYNFCFDIRMVLASWNDPDCHCCSLKTLD